MHSGVLRSGWTLKIRFYAISLESQKIWAYGMIINSKQTTPIATPKAMPTHCVCVHIYHACLQFWRELSFVERSDMHSNNEGTIAPVVMNCRLEDGQCSNTEVAQVNTHSTCTILGDAFHRFRKTHI